MNPLTKQQLKFIDSYVHVKDVGLATIAAGYKNKAQGKGLYANKRIREEIDRKLEIVFGEKAKIIAKEQLLTKEILDKELAAVVTVDVVKIPQLGPTKLNAIEMGYKRVGMIAGGEFLPDIDPDAPKAAAPARIFRVQEQAILTHRIETTEHVLTRTVQAEPPDPWA
jgi:hypothetical protein